MSTPLLCECDFQLVLAYNPTEGDLFGKRIEPEVLVHILSQLNMKFGDYRILGPPASDVLPAGTYKGQPEASVCVQVAIPEERIPELREFVIKVGERLGQEAMYFKAGPPSVEIIPIKKTKSG